MNIEHYHGKDEEQRWESIHAALGAIDDTGHEWDADPGAWVREQRPPTPAASAECPRSRRTSNPRDPFQ